MTRVACGGALAASALFLLVNLGSYPIVLWDESRLAVNAIEMFLTGPGLVTTFNFAPDHWNTKPPLLIWLMTASMSLLGPSEWAIRLPSALAALATIAVVMTFTWRLTRSASTVILSCVLLAASSGFHGPHAAATGDYDSLLTLFTTSYACVLFFVLHRRAPRPSRVMCAGLLVAAAILTKGVAGVIPGTGVVLYLLLTRRLARPFLTGWYLAAGAAVLLTGAAFYGLRELAEPGYLQAVLRNELATRYFDTVGGHPRRPWYYVAIIVRSTFSAGPLLVLVPVGLLLAKGRVRLGIMFASCIAAAIVLVFSSSETKLPWYVVPAYPFMAVALALSASVVVRRTSDEVRRWVGRSPVPDPAGVLAILLAVVITAAAAYRYEPLSDAVAPVRANYGRVFEELKGRGIHAVSIVDGGDPNTEGFEDYRPRLRFYQLMWQTRSFTVREIADDVTMLRKQPGTIVVTCDRRRRETVRRKGKPIAAVAGCVSVELLSGAS